MKRLVNGFRSGLKHFIAEFETLLAPSLESLRETDWFCIRFFISLQIAFFYGLLVLFFSIDLLPARPLIYILGSGSSGIFAAFLLKWSWTVGKVHRR